MKVAFTQEKKSSTTNLKMDEPFERPSIKTPPTLLELV